MSQLKGFTIIEVLIAVAVITIGVLGILGVIYQTTSYIALSSSRLVAIYLAQEGMEIVRNIRDTNWLNNRSWDQGLNTGVWEADYNDSALTPFQEDRNLRTNGGFYNYDSGQGTKFKRKITTGLTSCGVVTCLSVKSEVSWQHFGRSQKAETEGYLYNWLQQELP